MPGSRRIDARGVELLGRTRPLIEIKRSIRRPKGQSRLAQLEALKL